MLMRATHVVARVSGGYDAEVVRFFSRWAAVPLLARSPGSLFQLWAVPNLSM